VAALAAISVKQALAKTSTSAAIGLNVSTYVLDNKSDYSVSVNYEANTNYEPCLCNLTEQTCDAFCCCDIDCAFVSAFFFLSR